MNNESLVREKSVKEKTETGYLVPVDKDDLGRLEPQQLPEGVLYVDDTGNLVIKEEYIDNDRIKKVTAKLTSGYIKHWTKEEMEQYPDYIYYISMVDNGYLGDETFYELLVKKRGLILIQKARPTDNTCSIGYSPEENKWYGWSHRAIHGFTIGDVVKEGDLTNTSGLVEEYRIQHPEEDFSLPVGFVAMTINDAKRMAIAFAEAVS